MQDLMGAVLLGVLLAACSGGGDSTDERPEGSGDSGVEGLPPVSQMSPHLLSGGRVRGMWGSSRNDLYAAAGRGLLAHYDGIGWRLVEGPEAFVGRDLHAVFGFDSNDVFVAGERGVLAHFDGTVWTSQEVEGGWSGDIYGLWGAASDDVYAGADGAILHYDGTRWSVVEDPDTRSVSWRGISGSSASDVLVAGEGGNFESAHALHFTGADWVPVAVPDTGARAYLNNVWSVAPNQAFFVGTPGRTLTWNGTALAETTNPTNEALGGIWGVSDSEAFAVGVRNTLLRFDGSQWRDLPFDIGIPYTPSDDWVSDVYGFAGNDVLVGGRGIHHFDGASWTTLLPGFGPTAAWASSADDVLIFGATPHRWDGTTATPEDFGGLAVPTLRAAWGPADNIVAVASDGSAYRYDGAAWGVMTTNHSEPLADVWGSGPDDVFAVGNGGTILHFNGAAWGGMASGTDVALLAIAGTGPDNVVAVGADGTILRYDGVSWTAQESGVSSGLYDVAMFDGTEMYVAFDGGLLVGDGVTWSVRTVELEGVEQGLFRVSGTSPEDLFVAGAGFVAHYDQTTLTALPGRLGASFLEAIGPRTVVAGAGSGFDEWVALYTAK